MTGEDEAIPGPARACAKRLGRDAARFDGASGRWLGMARAHDDDTEEGDVRSVADADGSRSDGVRRHGGGRGAYETSTRRSSGACSQRGQRVTSRPVRR